MVRQHPVAKQDAWIPGAVPFFVFGLVYYLVSPDFVFHFLSADSELLGTATRYLGSSDLDSSSFLDGVAILLSFLFGYGLGRAVTKANPSVADYVSRKTTVPKVLALSFGALIVYFAVVANTLGARLLRVTVRTILPFLALNIRVQFAPRYGGEDA